MSGITFDGWKTQLYEDYLAHGQDCLIVGTDCLAIDQDSLMHFRTKGSKNGVRRYQMPDGTWTPLGLRERRVREGWGERREARREARAQRRSERKAARAAERSARKERMEQYKAERVEAKRWRDPKKLTNEELKAGIERLNMEQTYREMIKSPTIKLAEKMVSDYMERKAIKEERAYQEKQTKLTREFEMKKELEKTKQTEFRAKADKARADADAKRAETDKIDIEKGTRAMKLKNAKRELRLQARKFRSDSTIRGGIAKFFNKSMSSIADRDDSVRKAQIEVDGILAGRRKVDKYNRRRSLLNPPMQYVKTKDERDEAKRANDLAIEKQRTKQKKYESRKK